MVKRVPSVYADLMKAARQEDAWAKTAKIEAEDELARSKRYEKLGYPIMADELEWDHTIADQFFKLRLNRAKMYKAMAKQIKVSWGK